MGAWDKSASLRKSMTLSYTNPNQATAAILNLHYTKHGVNIKQKTLKNEAQNTIT